MGLENYSNIESAPVTPQNTQEKWDKELDALLREYSEMSPSEQADIIEAMANKDPEFNKMYLELKSFYQERVMNLEDYDIHLKIEAVKKFVEGVDLDYDKNESIRFEGNAKNLESIRAIFYRLGGDRELHSRYFTVGNIENQKLATIKEEFSAWIERTRAYIDRKYKAEEVVSEPEIKEEIIEEKAEPQNVTEVKDENKEISEKTNVNTNSKEETGEVEITKEILDDGSLESLVPSKSLNINEYIVKEQDENIFSSDFIEAIKRQKLNEEPLLKLLAKDELEALKVVQESELIALRENNLDGIIHREHWALLVSNHEERFENFRAEILEKQKEKVAEINRFLDTPRGVNLLNKSNYFAYERTTKDLIDENLGFSPELKGERESEITDNIYFQNNELLSRIEGISQDLAKEIEEMKGKHQEMIENGAVLSSYHSLVYKDIADKFEGLISTEIDTYAKDFGKYLITREPTLTAIKMGKTINMPIGDGKVSLNFSKLGDVDFNNKEALLLAFENNFEDIYRNDLSEKISDVFVKIGEHIKDKPVETAIEVLSIIISAFVTDFAYKFSSGASLGKSALIFTATDNAIRGTAFGALGLTKGEGFAESALEGIGINEDDNIEDIIRKKGLEYTSNLALFGIFKGTKYLKDKGLPVLEKAGLEMFKNFKKFGVPVAKTNLEALFFTEYVQFANGVDKAIQANMEKGANFAEATRIIRNEITAISNIDDFMELYTYNLGFVLAVKGGGKALDLGLTKVLDLQTRLDTEKGRLENEGFAFESTLDGKYNIYTPNGEKADLKSPELKNVILLTNLIAGESLVAYKKPDNGKAGKVMLTPKLREEKFADLEKFSSQAEKEGLSFSLEKDISYASLKETGIGGKTKGVEVSLLKEAGFESGEIKKFKEGKFELNSKKEKGVFEKMNEASNKLNKEYDLVLEKILFESKDISSVIQDYPVNARERLKTLIEEKLKI